MPRGVANHVAQGSVKNVCVGRIVPKRPAAAAATAAAVHQVNKLGIRYPTVSVRVNGPHKLVQIRFVAPHAQIVETPLELGAGDEARAVAVEVLKDASQRLAVPLAVVGQLADGGRTVVGGPVSAATTKKMI